MTTPARIESALSRAIAAESATRDAAKIASQEIEKARTSSAEEEGMEAKEQ